MLGMVIGLMAVGLPVAFAFLFANIVGAFIFMGGMIGLEQLVSNATRSISSFLLLPVPLFILMGELFFHTGLAARVFDALDKLFGRLPGRLSYLTVTGGTLFSTLSGSSMASTAMLGSVMLPETIRRGYKKHMAMGPILGTGGLAIIIPPSALAVLLGSLARIDVGALLVAGIIPGFVLATLYVGLIYVQVKLDPDAAPQYPVESVSLGVRFRLVVTHILPMGLVVFAVVGFIILGIATPTESAAFGVLGVLVLAVAFRLLTWQAFRNSVEAALKVSVMVFTIILGSKTFSQIMAFSGATNGLVSWATDFELVPLVMLLVMFAVLLVLVMFVDQVSQMMLTLPAFMPLAQALGFDPVWFGIIILLSMEMSGTTPPVWSLAVRPDGGRAARHDVGSSGPGGRALPHLRRHPARPADRLPGNRPVFARLDGLTRRAQAAGPRCGCRVGHSRGDVTPGARTRTVLTGCAALFSVPTNRVGTRCRRAGAGAGREPMGGGRHGCDDSVSQGTTGCRERTASSRSSPDRQVGAG